MNCLFNKSFKIKFKSQLLMDNRKVYSQTWWKKRKEIQNNFDKIWFRTRNTIPFLYSMMTYTVCGGTRKREQDFFPSVNVVIVVVFHVHYHVSTTSFFFANSSARIHAVLTRTLPYDWMYVCIFFFLQRRKYMIGLIIYWCADDIISVYVSILMPTTHQYQYQHV